MTWASGDSLNSNNLNTKGVGPVYNVLAYGAVSTTTTIDSRAAVLAAISAATAAGGGRVLFPGMFYLSSPITVTNPSGLIFEGLRSPGLSLNTSLYQGEAGWGVKSQGISLDLGSDTTQTMQGPHFVNFAVQDSSTTGAALCGIMFRNVNGVHMENFHASNFSGGAAWIWNAPLQNQYWTIINPRIMNCKHVFRKWGDVSDVDWFGGLCQGREFGMTALRSGSTALSDESGEGGRMRVFGTGFNDWQGVLEVRKWKNLYFNAVFEQNALFTGQGIAVHGIGDTGNTDAINCVFVGNHITKFASAFSIGANCKRWQLFANTFLQNTSAISDSGQATTIIGVQPPDENTAGLRLGYATPNGKQRQTALSICTTETNADAIPTIYLPSDNTHASNAVNLLLKNANSNHSGGLWLAAHSASDAGIGGGIVGDSTNPRAVGANGAFIKFSGSATNIYSFTGSTSGTTLTPSSQLDAAFEQQGALTLRVGLTSAGVATPAAGYATLFLSSAGTLCIKRADGSTSTVGVQGI